MFHQSPIPVIERNPTQEDVLYTDRVFHESQTCSNIANDSQTILQKGIRKHIPSMVGIESKHLNIHGKFIISIMLS